MQGEQAGATTSEPAPALECDVVMKGGVTSGIVYPSAIAAIARDYRLRSIGGTSVGAIAAAAAAAMEFGRRSGRNPAARQQLENLPAKLGGNVPGEPSLAELFTPDRETAGVFNLVWDLAKAGAARGRLGVAGHLLAWPFLAAALLAALLTIFLLRSVPGSVGPANVVVPVLLFLLSLIVLTAAFAGIWWIPRVLRGIRSAGAMGFGVCSGYSERLGRRSLAGWLHAEIQSLAGLGPAHRPICFGDLWAAAERTAEAGGADPFDWPDPAAPPGPVAGPDIELGARDIDLVFVASDISRAQTVQLPFLRRADRLYFRRSDLLEQFPEDIVNWMELRAGPRELAEVETPEGMENESFFRLPPAEVLPILFGVRMSMSFPGLFRAVRLYVVRRATGGAQKLEPLWLADGGITSNFPIHLFDSPIPSRPTFCLNLLYHDDQLEPDPPGPKDGDGDADGGEEDEAEASAIAEAKKGEIQAGTPDPKGQAEQLVYMLRRNRGRLSAYTELPGGGLSEILRFGSRVVTTARQWNDNHLIDVPGYRDRIVHIKMRKDEGGFHFDLDADQIKDLAKRGETAGEAIAGRFRPDATKDPLYKGEDLRLTWANHRMVRFRAFLAGVEVTAAQFTANWWRDFDRAETPAADPDHVEPSLYQMIDTPKGAKPSPRAQSFGYRFANDAQADLAHEMVKAINALTRLGVATPGIGIDYVNDRSTSPRQKSVVRLRPLGDDDRRSMHPPVPEDPDRLYP